MNDSTPHEPSLTDNHAQSPGLARPLLDQLLADQCQRWQHGERVPAETYRDEQPALRRDEEAMLDLIYQEIVLREERGEAPQLEEYQERFPALASHLALLFALDRLVRPRLTNESAPTAPQPAPGGGRPPAGLPAVPGYEVLCRLGAGAMGIVYKAREEALDRLVALKIMRPEVRATPGAAARFRGEAEVVAGLRHPNVVQLYHAGEADGVPYFALEFVDGGSLADRLAQAPQPVQSAAPLLETLARAVHCAHEHGVVHRDLKPGNVLLTADGTPKVSDFGLAKRLDPELTQSMPGNVLGTPWYMAPEQVPGPGGGPAGKVGPAADVYALGVILYEVLTGRVPFRGETWEDLLEQVRAREPVPPARLNPRVPRDLETVCLKCLKKEPAQRYASAEALADDLRRFQERKPIQARPVGRWERAVKWAKRRPAAAALIAVSTAAALGLVGGLAAYSAEVYQHNRRLEETNGQKDVALRKALLAEEAAQAEERQSRRIAYPLDLKLAEQDWEEGNISRLRERLRRHLPVPGKEDLRTFEWYYWSRLCHSELHVLRPSADKVFCVAFSRDGKKLASGSADGTIKLWDPATGQELPFKIAKHPSPRCLAFSPDGSKLAVGCVTGQVSVCDLAAQERPFLFPVHGQRPVQALAYSPDGTQLASAGLDRMVVVSDPATGRAQHSFPPHGDNLSCMAFSPGGKRLAVASERFDRGGTGRLGFGEIKVWDMDGRTELASLKGPVTVVKSLAFSPDGERLAAGALDGAVRLWALGGAKELWKAQGHKNEVCCLTFCADGTRLASGGLDGAVLVWDTAAGKQVDVRKGHAGGVEAVAFHPDKQTLATAGDDQTVRLWDLRVSHAQPPLAGPVSPLVAISADVRTLAVVGRDGNTVDLWDLASGRKLDGPGGHRKRIRALAASADGRTLATADDDQKVKLWDVADWKVRPLPDHEHAVSALALSADGRLLAAGGDGAVTLWDAPTGERLRTWRAGMATALAFAPDGKSLALGGRETAPDGRLAHVVRLFDLAAGQERTLGGHADRVTALAFAPDGRTLASGGKDQVVRVWGLEAKRELLTLQHPDAVRFVAFADRGRTLVSAGVGVKLWDTATGLERAAFAETRGVPCVSVAIAPDGRVLVAAAADGRLFRWEAATEEQVREWGR